MGFLRSGENPFFSSLYSQVTDNIDFSQFALPGKSTTHALIYILHCILKALNTAMLEFHLQTLAKGSTLCNLGVYNVLITWIDSFSKK